MQFFLFFLQLKNLVSIKVYVYEVFYMLNSQVISKDILLLKNVFAEITLKNSGKIFIYSDQAKYNKSNLNTHFFENVELNYEDHNIKSENIFLDYVTKEVKIAENVVYNDSNNKLNADAIDMDLITKFSKIYMINKDNKITATIKN